MLARQLACLAVAGLALGCIGTEPIPAQQKNGLLLSVETLEALEGGPVVCKLTLVNESESSVFVSGLWRLLPQSQTIQVSSPATWEEPTTTQAAGVFGMAQTDELPPGGRLSRLVFLHQQFAHIPKGKHRVGLTWAVASLSTDQMGKPLESCPAQVNAVSTTLDIDVQPSSNVARERVLSRLSDSCKDKVPAASLESLAQEVIGVRDPAFLPVAYLLLQQRELPSATAYRLRLHAYRLSRKTTDSHKELVAFLKKYGSKPDHPFFDGWSEDRVVLSDDEIESLLAASQPWIQAYTCKLFPTKCSLEQKKEISNQSKEIREFIEKE